MPLKRKTLPLLLLLLTGFAVSIGGCGGPVTLHPIGGSDIFEVPVGSIITLDGAATTVVKPGWFISDFYLEEIIKAKVDK